MENDRENSGLVAKVKRHGIALAAACTLLGGGYGCIDRESIVVQYANSSEVLNCWRVSGDVWHIGNMLYWDGGSASGILSRMAVRDGQWEETARALGIDLERCIGGRYQNE